MECASSDDRKTRNYIFKYSHNPWAFVGKYWRSFDFIGLRRFSMSWYCCWTSSAKTPTLKIATGCRDDYSVTSFFSSRHFTCGKNNLVGVREAKKKTQKKSGEREDWKTKRKKRDRMMIVGFKPRNNDVIETSYYPSKVSFSLSCAKDGPSKNKKRIKWRLAPSSSKTFYLSLSLFRLHALSLRTLFRWFIFIPFFPTLCPFFPLSIRNREWLFQPLHTEM